MQYEVLLFDIVAFAVSPSLEVFLHVASSGII